MHPLPQPNGTGIAVSILAVLLCASCAVRPADLVIENAAVFNSRTGEVDDARTIVVRDGVIASVGPSDADALAATRMIDAAGRLVTPGFIDVHHHTAEILADSANTSGGSVANLVMESDSIAVYRRRFAEAYLPHGVTVVREAGGDDRYLQLMRTWMEPVPWAPDFYASGGALVSHEEGRRPFAGHTVVRDSNDAARTVRRYHEAGFLHVKLYWRLRMPELRAALREAQQHGMTAYGHIDYKVLSIREAIALGLRHFEHAYTLGVEVLTLEENREVWRRTRDDILQGDMRGAFFMGITEMFNELGPDDSRMDVLIGELARAGVTMTPTLHVFAAPLGLAHFSQAPANDFADTSGWTDAQRARARRGYQHLSSYVRRLHEAGVRLSLGTDAADPGRAALSEMLLLHAAGIPIADTLTIATLNSARALGLADRYGSIEAGRRAHLVLFDENPLERPEALLGAKTVIKDGVVHHPPENWRATD